MEAGPRPRTRLKNHGLSLVGFMQDSFNGLCLAGHEGMEKKMETTIMGYIGTTIRIHSIFLATQRPV